MTAISGGKVYPTDISGVLTAHIVADDTMADLGPMFATLAQQDTLSSIDDSLRELQFGDQPAANALSVILSSDQHVLAVSGTLAISNFPSTQPVSGVVSVDNLPSTQTVTGTVSVANFPATQPVSGTLTANIGTTGGLALDSNLTSFRAQVPTTLGQKTSANSLAVVLASDQSAVPVSGTVTANSPTWLNSPIGSITAAASGQITSVATLLKRARIGYSGSATVYFQFHNKVSATAFSNSTLLGFGYEISPGLNDLVIELVDSLSFTTGLSWAMSTTKFTYTASAETVYVFSQYL